MPGTDHPPSASRRYAPSMIRDYSRISDTARAMDLAALPGIVSYLKSARDPIARMPAGTPFVIADYGAADAANSSRLFECIITAIRGINPSLGFRLVYIDIADPGPFDEFWEGSHLSELNDVEAEYIRRSFYEPLPELAGRVNFGFSSTALHWLDAQDADADLFQHPSCIQANQLPEYERRRFVEKWESDWRRFFHERSCDLVDGGLLFMANLTSLGADRWPASEGYEYLRDVCLSLSREGRISESELQAIFIPDYFATPDEMRSVIEEDGVREQYSLKSFEAMTVPCAYFARMHDALGNAQERRLLADTLAHVVRAWSESSIRAGLSSEYAGLMDEVYSRLADTFFEVPRGLPYQYCLIGLVRTNTSTG